MSEEMKRRGRVIQGCVGQVVRASGWQVCVTGGVPVSPTPPRTGCVWSKEETGRAGGGGEPEGASLC